MKYLNFFLLLFFTFSLITGCASSPPRDKRLAEEYTPPVQLYEQKTEPWELTKKEREAIRPDTITVNFDIRQDEAGQWFIDLHQFETYGLKAGESIVWECGKNIPFTVYFGWVSPFEKGVYPAKKRKEGDGYYTDVARTRERFPLEAKAIEFKYTIAAAVEYTVKGEKKTEVIVYDPLMFIQPHGSNYH